MTSIDGQTVPPAAPASMTDTQRVEVAVRARASRREGWRIYVLPLASSFVGLAAGGAAIFANDLDVLAPYAAGLVVLALGAALLVEFLGTGRWDRGGAILAGACLAAAVIIAVLPAYLYGFQVNGVVHRSAVSGPLLLAVSVLALSHSIRRLLGDTPTARDIALYPLVLLPIVVAFVAYGMLLAQLVVRGGPALSLDLLLTPWGQQLVGEPGSESFAYQLGLRNHILGTLLLMGMTCLISILPGVGVGVYLSEYPGRMARIIGFSTTMLRAMSVFIIGIAAFGVVGLAVGLPADALPSRLIRGTFSLTEGGITQPGGGSFLLASAFLSLLVIPIIAKLTEEGLRSVPRDIREGSVAAGATEGYGLRRILLPWAGPNIITGLLLGAAEAGGSLAIILFLSGDGEYGVGPLSPVTGLDFALYSTRYGSQAFISTMGYRAPVDYAYTAALLLLVITLGLTVVAMLVRRRFARRYRGSLTIG